MRLITDTQRHSAYVLISHHKQNYITFCKQVEAYHNLLQRAVMWRLTSPWLLYYWHAQQYKKLSCRRETARRFVSLNISLSHSRSLNVIRNDTVESMSVFHWNYVCISYRFWDIQRQRMTWPWNPG